MKFLSQYSCGFTTNIPNVCCPLEQNLIGRVAPSSSTSSTTPSTTSSTTSSFRLIEETTKPNKRINSRGNDNDLRVGKIFEVANNCKKSGMSGN